MPLTEKEKKKVVERTRQERQKERPVRVLFTTPEGKMELGQKLTSCLTTSVPHLRMTGGGGLAQIIVSKNAQNIEFFF